MQLTPVDGNALRRALDHIGRALAGDGIGTSALARIAASRAPGTSAATPATHRSDAVALARAFGIATLDEAPAAAFSWDGARLRTRSEASVILHEIAHWQICPPDRRHLPDFGLGAGPETGDKAAADRAAVADFDTRQREETQASMLGILWEAALDQPAFLAFQEQNWLEGWDRPATAAAIAATVDALHARGLIDATGAPLRPRSSGEW